MGFNIDLVEPLPQRNVTDEQLQDVTCVICVDIVQEPKQCEQCNNVFCKICIEDWLEKQNTCPFKCQSGNNKMSFQTFQGPKKDIYDQIKVRCQIKCYQYFQVSVLQQHEIMCRLEKCQNYDQCSGYQIYLMKGIKCCSYSCYKSIKKDQPLGATQPMKVCFDFDNCSNNYRKINSQSCSFNYQGAKIFSTIISKVQLFGGKHEIKVKIQNGGGNLKLGFTTSKDFDLKQTSFSDYNHGYGWYNKGQLRNGSDFYGKQYGISLFDLKNKKDYDVTCIVDMSKGIISFELDGKEYGQAYQSDELKYNPIYFAFAAGSTIDSITLNNNQIQILQLWLNVQLKLIVFYIKKVLKLVLFLDLIDKHLKTQKELLVVINYNFLIASMLMRALNLYLYIIKNLILIVFSMKMLIILITLLQQMLLQLKKFCPSLPGFYYMNQRAFEINLIYNDQKLKQLQSTFKGNYAYQIQMNIDQSNGLHFLNLDRIGDNDLQIYEPYKDLFPNCIKEIKDFNTELKNLKYDDTPDDGQQRNEDEISSIQGQTAINFQNQKLIQNKAYKDFMHCLYYDYSEIQAMKEQEFLAKVDKKLLHPKENPSFIYLIYNEFIKKFRNNFERSSKTNQLKD